MLTKTSLIDFSDSFTIKATSSDALISSLKNRNPPAAFRRVSRSVSSFSVFNKIGYTSSPPRRESERTIARRTSTFVSFSKTSTSGCTAFLCIALPSISAAFLLTFGSESFSKEMFFTFGHSPVTEITTRLCKERVFLIYPLRCKYKKATNV